MSAPNLHVRPGLARRVALQAVAGTAARYSLPMPATLKVADVTTIKQS